MVVVGGIHFAVGSIVGVGGKHYWLGHPSGVAESLGEGQQRPLDLVVLHGAVLAEQVVLPVHSVVLEGVEEAGKKIMTMHQKLPYMLFTCRP